MRDARQPRCHFKDRDFINQTLTTLAISLKKLFKTPVSSMHTSITTLNLNGFESLKGELKKLAKINILIGPNGSGKSSVLRLIRSCTQPSKLSSSESLGDLDEQTTVLGSIYSPPDIQPSTRTSLSFEHFKKISMLFPNAVINEVVSQSPFQSESPGSKTEGVTTSTVEHLNGVPHRNLEATAPGGYRLAARIKQDIEKAAKPKAHHPGTVKPAFILLCIEEPETGLHPSIQKDLLRHLLEWLTEFSLPVQCLITTHSPFIVSAAADIEDCRVYLMKDCQPCDLSGRAGTQAAFDGFTGKEALLAVHSLLGSGINDFVPSLTFCENSVHAFLVAIASKGGPAVRSCVQTVTGDSDAVHKGSTLGQVYGHIEKHVLQSGPANGVVPGSIAVIVDGPLSETDEGKVSRICSKRKFSVHRLGTRDELEANYPERLVIDFFDSRSFTKPQVLSITKSLDAESKNVDPKGKVKKAWVGEKKAELAKYVVSHASSVELEEMKLMVTDLYRRF
jgi:AAA domain, putative AbiEii toxin, Type IV TA system